MSKFTISGTELELSPLKMKHLRRISELIKEGQNIKNASFSDLDRWVPFVVDSIQAKNPNFKEEELENLSLTEFADLWSAIIELSGIRIVGKGEQSPTETSTTQTSSPELPAPSAGRIQ